MISHNIFVTAIDTNVGKTVVSSLLVKALQADYWKPFQCGTDEETDSQFIKRMTAQEGITVHKESYCLKTPQSPHYAAEQEELRIDLDQVKVPDSKNSLIVEGAGGILVPLNDKDYVIDLAVREKMLTILVTQHFLGSLNHTFLSVEALRRRGLRILGLVFNGEENLGYEKFVSEQVDLPVLFKTPSFPNLTKDSLSSFAPEVKKKMEYYL